MTQSYTASDIEVLKGLEPVRRRPGMYTDTRSPNHLVHEVVDNSRTPPYFGVTQDTFVRQLDRLSR